MRMNSTQMYASHRCPQTTPLKRDSKSGFILNQNQKSHYFTSAQSLSGVQLFATPWTVAHQASLSITNSWSMLKLMFIKSVILSNHLILSCCLFLLPSIFPASGSFPMSQFFASGGQSIDISALASVPSMNIQD